MSAKYLIRLDDACHTMKLENWILFEEIFDKYSIKPIIAVIPNNKDKTLEYDSNDNFFWKRINKWKNKGWTIAMHGYEHNLDNTCSKSLLPFYKRSEFTGKEIHLQKEKILNSLAIFRENGISPNVFVAPAHTFDENTLKSIKDLTNIKIISDGLALNFFYFKNFYWIPVQMWNYIKLPFGLWTLCLHPNTMTSSEIFKIDKKIRENNKNFISLSDVKVYKRKKSFFDHLFSYVYWTRRKVKIFLS